MSKAKRKVCVVVTARPSYSRIRTALEAIQAHPDLELQLVLAASALLDRYGNLEKIVKKDGFEVAARVYMVMEGETPLTMAKTTGMGMIELASVFDHLKPDMVVTIADRFETLATAVAASYMNIPLVHIQGGEITGSIDEKVRHAVTKLANLHLVSTEPARERVVRMGEDPEAVHVTGCPSIDIAADVLRKPALDFDPIKKYGGVGAAIDVSQGYIIAMQHPVTTEWELARQQVLETIQAVHDSGKVCLWFWPNVDAGSDATSNGIRSFREKHNPKNIHFFKNVEPDDFLHLLVNSQGIVGNSSAGIRECSFLGTPAVNIGTRQSDRDRGPNVLDVKHDRSEILKAIQEHCRGRQGSSPMYGDGNAGPRIADLLSRVKLNVEKRLRY